MIRTLYLQIIVLDDYVYDLCLNDLRLCLYDFNIMCG